MQFSPSDLLDINTILYDIVEECSDKQYREQTKGWYISHVQQALAEIEFDAKFVQRFHDQAIPTDRKISLPTGAFNIQEVYVYNGLVGEPSGKPKKVWWKRNMRSNPGKEFSSRIRAGEDNIYGNTADSQIESRLFCNAVNGILELSASCTAYTYVRIQYNGTNTPIGDVPFIPPVLRQYVIGYVVTDYWRIMKGRYPDTPRYRTNYLDAYTRLTSIGDGLTDVAKGRVKRLDSMFIRDMQQYLSKMNY